MPATPPIVLIHGWGGSGERTWSKTGWLEAIEDRGRSAFAIDVVGHGTAPAPSDPAAYGDLTTSLESQLPVTESTDLIGFSLGAKLALELSRRRGAGVRRVVCMALGDNAFRAENPAPLIEGLRSPGSEKSPAIVELVRYARESGNDVEALIACISRPPNPRLTEAELAEVEATAMLIVGERDEFIGGVDRLAAALGGPPVERVAGFGHLDLPDSAGARGLALDFLFQAG